MDCGDFTEAAVVDLTVPEQAAQSLVELLEKKGTPARIVSLDHVHELRDEICGRFVRGELDLTLYERYRDEFTFAVPDDFTNLRSIVIAAVPRPRAEAVFEFHGQSRRIAIPPTYTDYDAIATSWVRWLDATIRRSGYRAAPSSLPLKLLATRSGLARYGRNNITFVPGLGSFYELVAAFTDIPCDTEGWAAPRMLDRCAHCRACVNRCPTGAIRTDRFLLDSARCLVFHNERDAAFPFPDWIDPSAHHTLIGCMKCQEICPENLKMKEWVGAIEEFSESETGMFLSGAGVPELSDQTRQKLERLDALRFLGRMPRNLRAALK